MTLSLAQLEEELLAHLGVESTDFTNGLTDVDLLLNRSWWQVMDEFKFREKETKTDLSTVSGTSSYNLATTINPLIFDALQIVSIEDPDTFEHHILKAMTIQDYESKYVDDSDSEAMPTHYVRRGGDLILYPSPDEVYTVSLYYWQILGDIASSGLTIPQNWHEIVLYGAVWRGFIRLGDYNRSGAARKLQAELISNTSPVEAKEKETLPFAGLQVMGRDY